MNLYVTAPNGRMIPRWGSREYGEFWDNLPDDMAQGYAQLEGFSLEDPNAKTTEKILRAPKRRELEAEEGNNG